MGLLRTCSRMLAFSWIVAGCSSQTITFEGGPETSASLVSWDKLASEGKSLGPMPVTVESEALAGQVVKLSGKGKSSVYWVLEAANESALKVHMDLPVASSSGEGGDLAGKQADAAASKQADNRALRLTLRAYKALWEKDLELTKKLAGELHDLRPDLAAAPLLTGLAQLQGGQNAAARTAFAAAKALDPEDADIDNLLKLAQ